MNYYWIRCTEYELSALHEATGGVAVIPLASIESHGPHLPLGSDPLCIDHIVEQVLDRTPVAVMPTLTYSYVAEARSLPGAIHIPSHILMDYVEAICDEIHRNGWDKIVLLHGHGGNVALHWMFLRRTLERQKPYAVYSIPVFGNAGEKIKALFSTEIGHACEFETALNMVAAPQHVNLDALGEKTFPTQEAPETDAALTPVDFISRHPEMAIGEPQKATRESGEAARKIWMDEIVRLLDRVKQDEVNLREMRRYSAQVDSVREKVRGKA